MILSRLNRKSRNDRNTAKSQHMSQRTKDFLVILDILNNSLGITLDNCREIGLHLKVYTLVYTYYGKDNYLIKYRKLFPTFKYLRKKEGYPITPS